MVNTKPSYISLFYCLLHLIGAQGFLRKRKSMLMSSNFLFQPEVCYQPASYIPFRKLTFHEFFAVSIDC